MVDRAGSFFDGAFIVISVIALVFWSMAYVMAEAMRELELSPFEKSHSPTDPDYDLWTAMPHRGRTDRQAHMRSIMNTFFWGGVILLVLTGLAVTDMDDLMFFRNERVSGVVLNALIYFLTAFLLISQAQYTILKANWQLQDIPIVGKLDRRWLAMVVSFLLVIAIVAALLPVGYSVGLIEDPADGASVDHLGHRADHLSDHFPGFLPL